MGHLDGTNTLEHRIQFVRLIGLRIGHSMGLGLQGLFNCGGSLIAHNISPGLVEVN
jgi:hypothetical protein